MTTLMGLLVASPRLSAIHQLRLDLAWFAIACVVLCCGIAITHPRRRHERRWRETRRAK